MYNSIKILSLFFSLCVCQIQYVIFFVFLKKYQIHVFIFSFFLKISFSLFFPFFFGSISNYRTLATEAPKDFPSFGIDNGKFWWISTNSTHTILKMKNADNSQNPSILFTRQGY